MKDLRNKAQEVIEQVNRYVLGKKPEVREVMIAILAGGHVLLEDMPGVGKTTMAVVCVSEGELVLQPAAGR